METDVTDTMEEYLNGVDVKRRSTYDRPELAEYLSVHREKFRKHIPYSLFCMFWYLSLDCIYYPNKPYGEKLEELKVQPP